MKYALVDMEGATVETFDSAPEARYFLRAELKNSLDGDAPIDDLLILGYSDGQRRGLPVDALDFLASDPRNSATVARLAPDIELKVAIIVERSLANEPALTGHQDEVRVVAIDPAALAKGFMPMCGNSLVRRRAIASNC